MSILDKSKEKLREKAEKGNLTAAQMLQKIQSKEDLEEYKESLLEGKMFEKPESKTEEVMAISMPKNDSSALSRISEISIEEIDKYVRSGKFTTLPEKYVVYLKWMEKAQDWYYRYFNREIVVQYLRQLCVDEQGKSISKYIANKIFVDMINFFYANKKIRKAGYMNYYAERLEMAAMVSWKLNDMDAFGKNIERAAKIRDMIPEEEAKVDPRLLDKSPTFYYIRPEDVGVAQPERRKLAKDIDDLPNVPDIYKRKIKQDLGIIQRSLASDAVVVEEENNQ